MEASELTVVIKHLEILGSISGILFVGVVVDSVEEMAVVLALVTCVEAEAGVEVPLSDRCVSATVVTVTWVKADELTDWNDDKDDSAGEAFGQGEHRVVCLYSEHLGQSVGLDLAENLLLQWGQVAGISEAVEGAEFATEKFETTLLMFSMLNLLFLASSLNLCFRILSVNQ